MALLMLGRERGYLTPDDFMEVLEGVELTPELIAAVIGRVTAEGIDWRESGEMLSDEGLDKLAAEVLRESRWGAANGLASSKAKGHDAVEPGNVPGDEAPPEAGPPENLDLDEADAKALNGFLRKKSRDPFRQRKASSGCRAEARHRGRRFRQLGLGPGLFEGNRQSQAALSRARGRPRPLRRKGHCCQRAGSTGSMVPAPCQRLGPNCFKCQVRQFLKCPSSSNARVPQMPKFPNAPNAPNAPSSRTAAQAFAGETA